jgi:hypothetical protein
MHAVAAEIYVPVDGTVGVVDCRRRSTYNFGRFNGQCSGRCNEARKELILLQGFCWILFLFVLKRLHHEAKGVTKVAG